MFKPAFAVLSLLLGAVAIPAQAAAAAPQFYGNGSAARPFSAAVRIGHMVYTSGVIGVDKDGKLPSDFTQQATNAMDALAAELKLADASMDDVYKCHVALADMKDWPAFNKVYVKYFKLDHLPVRMAAGANGLALGAAVEVQCEAYTHHK